MSVRVGAAAENHDSIVVPTVRSRSQISDIHDNSSASISVFSRNSAAGFWFQDRRKAGVGAPPGPPQFLSESLPLPSALPSTPRRVYVGMPFVVVRFESAGVRSIFVARIGSEIRDRFPSRCMGRKESIRVKLESALLFISLKIKCRTRID